MRRRLQESFHLAPAAAASGASGFFSSLAGHHAAHAGHGGHLANGQIPSISVSVQTEPSMVNMNGNTTLAHTTSLVGNGGSGLFQNGVNSNPNGVLAVANERPPPGNYATLPHPHHHLQSIHVSLSKIAKRLDL